MKNESTRHFYRRYLPYEIFKSIGELNKTTTAILREHGEGMTKSQLAIFKELAHFSATIFGVSFQRVDRWADHMNVNERTIRRAFKRLEALGIIKRYKQRRGPDVLVIQPKESCLSEGTSDEMSGTYSDEKPHEDAVKKDGSLKETIKTSTIHRPTGDLDHTYLPSSVPTSFIETVRPFFGQADDIYSYWKRVLMAHKSSKLDAPIESVIDDITSVFKRFIFVARRKRIRSMLGYFFVCVAEVFTVARRREVYNSGRWPIGDWLTDFTNSETAS